MRTHLIGGLAVACLVSGLAIPAGAVSGPSDWSIPMGAWNYSSSPAVADIDNDGHDEVVIGSREGWLKAIDGDGSLIWHVPVIPHIPAECIAQSTPSPIDSTPAIGDLDGDGTVEIVVGVGSSHDRGSHSGGLVAFSHTGSVEWKWQGNRDYGGVNTFTNDGRCEGVASSPAIGDVDGDGHDDVVFGGFDGRVWALDRNGNTVAGFPFESYDTIWSSPALFDVDNDGAAEIFIGVDSWPGVVSNFHQGGLLRALDVSGGAVTQLWAKYTSDIVASSPAIGDINGDGRAEVVFGTGEYWFVACTHNADPACPTYAWGARDHQKVWAVDALDGTDVSGWPVSANGTVQTAPALGDIDADGQLEVVFGSYDEYVYAYNGDGTRLWATKANTELIQGAGWHYGRRITGHPIIVDLDGDGDLDVAVGNELFVGHHDGRTGHVIGHSGFGQSYITAPAIVHDHGTRYIVQSGFDSGLTSEVVAEVLPGTSAPEFWPQFRRNAKHTGALADAWCDLTVGMTSQFCDVPLGAWYANAVVWAADNNITSGVAPKIFNPGGTVTRGQVVTFLWRIEGSPGGYPNPRFIDVVNGAYYADAVAWAKATGVTTGIGPGMFGPEQSMTRAQMVTMLWRLVGEPGAPPSNFSDVPAGSFFARAVDWAAATGVTNGIGPGIFAPGNNVSRAQLIAMLYRWLNP